jgi:DNA polymerase-3 subunit epsilon
MTWNEGPLLGFDLETTGLDPCSDLPVQIALVHRAPLGTLDYNVFIVDPGREIPANAEAIHGISTRRARREGRPLAEAAAVVHRALRRAQSEQVPVVAMNASFDITIAALLFRRFDLEPLSWDVLVDPLVIDRQVDRERCGDRRLEALCATYGVVLGTPHDAGSDAGATIAVARELAIRYPEIASLEIGELTRRQAGWHRSWVVEHDKWCREHERPGSGPEEFGWPLRVLPSTPNSARSWLGPRCPTAAVRRDVR